MRDEVMVPIYVVLVREGIYTIERVPEIIRSRVEETLANAPSGGDA